MVQLDDLFFLYLDSSRRRAALEPASHTRGDRYLLYGLRQYQNQGYRVRHNLEKPRRSSRPVHFFSWFINKMIRLYGGIGGDFRSLISNLKLINKSDLVVSTVDPVGIPLVFLKAMHLIKCPAVYVSVGFPERIQRFRSQRVLTCYCRMFAQLDAVVGYGYEECRLLRHWLRQENRQDIVHFVPFGVDVKDFLPGRPRKIYERDILSIGADSYRDFSLLVQFAKNHPNVSIEIITSQAHRNDLLALPANIHILCDISLEQMKKRIEKCRIVVLPVKENSYSGATTTLLQVMAMEKPVLVSKVGAIRNGYNLENGENCLLLEPGDERDLMVKTELLLNDAQLQQKLAGNARKTVLQGLTWEHYVKNMLTVMTGCYREYRRKDHEQI